MVALEDLLLDVEWHHEWFKGQGYEMKAPLIFQDKHIHDHIGHERWREDA